MGKRSRRVREGATPSSQQQDPGEPIARAGRREHDRVRIDRRPALERYRGPIIAIAGIAVVAVTAAWLFVVSTQKAYACSTILDPAALASPLPGQIGSVVDDLGNHHVSVGTVVRYTYCPPASGQHYNQLPDGPIPEGFYGQDRETVPEGWIHNLEHGQLVVLYSCSQGGCGQAELDRLAAFYRSLPPSPVCGFPNYAVVTRFEDMKAPVAALTWGRIMFQQTLDTDQLLAYFEANADRGPEPQCASPSPTPAQSPAQSPAASPSPSAP